MLIRHMLHYTVARGLPGLINLAALVVYTRLLTTEEFGRYSLVLAVVGIANVVLFQWLRLVLARFLPARREAPEAFLGEVLSIFLVVALAAAGTGGLLAFLFPDPLWQRLLALAMLLLLTQAWFELNLGLAQTTLRPGWYGRLMAAKVLIALALGGALAWLGLGAAAPLTGLVVAHVLAFLLFGTAAWRGVALRRARGRQLEAQLRYGLPLAFTFAVAWIVSSSDRVLIEWFLDTSAVGAYAAAYDLVFPSLMLLLGIINMAAYPLAIRAQEDIGPDGAKRQLERNGGLIFAAALSGAGVLVVLGPHVVGLVLGEAFRADALRLLPWIAVGAAFAGINAFHFNLAFHLSTRNGWLMLTGSMAAVVNLALNVVLIPRFGIVGAAWASAAAFALAAGCGAVLGRRIFAMPSLGPMLARGFLVATAASVAAWLATQPVTDGPVALILGLCAGLAGGGLAAVLSDVAGLRDAVRIRRQPGESEDPSENKLNP